MEIKISQLKKNARRSLYGNWRLVFGMAIISTFIGWLSTTENWWGIIVTYALTIPFLTGMLWFYLDFYQKEVKEAPRVWDPSTDNWVVPDYQHPHPLSLTNILQPFNHGFKFYLKVVALNFWVGLFTVLWTLLLVVPGIIKSMSYSQATYLLKANQELGVFEAIKESRRLMNGQKKKYLLIILSLFGWFLIPGIALIALFVFNWSGELITQPYYDFMLLPLYFMFNGEVLISAVTFLILSYYAFWYLPYYWIMLGGFHKELIGEREEPILTTKKNPLFPKVVMGVTVGLVIFTMGTSEHPAFVRLRQEMGIESRTTLFYVESTISEVEADALVVQRWGETRIAINDSTTVVIYDGVPGYLELFGGLPFWDVQGAGQQTVMDLRPQEARVRVQNWLEHRLADGTATMGDFSDLAVDRWATLVGASDGEEGVADFIILMAERESLMADYVEGVSFGGFRAAREQVFDSQLGVYETYLYFPDAVFDPKGLMDPLVMEWINNHSDVTDYFSWIQLELMNGHRLLITNTAHNTPPALLYRQPDPSMPGGWVNRYIGEVPPGSNEIAWIHKTGIESVPSLSPLGRRTPEDEPPLTLDLTPIPNFPSIAEYIEWANNLDWDLTIAVRNHRGEWIDHQDLGEYTIQPIFSPFVGPGDSILWIEVSELGEQDEWVYIPHFATIPEYRAWLTGLGWGTEIVIYDVITLQAVNENELTNYSIITVSSDPTHTYLWIGVQTGE